MGACVGVRGSRIKNIVRELQGEKVDIVRWSENIKEYVKAAISPAKVSNVELYLDERKLDIEVDGTIPLKEAHDLSTLVEKNIKQNIKNVYDVLVHVEPLGNREADEVYGVSEDQL